MSSHARKIYNQKAKFPTLDRYLKKYYLNLIGLFNKFDMISSRRYSQFHMSRSPLVYNNKPDSHHALKAYIQRAILDIGRELVENVLPEIGFTGSVPARESAEAI